MKLKLDENLGRGIATLLRQEGFDVDTARDEGLAGAADEMILAAAAGERRILVTLDLDFANIRRFNPAGSPGIIVLRPASNLFAILRSMITLTARELRMRTVTGSTWIVEPGRIRIHSPE